MTNLRAPVGGLASACRANQPGARLQKLVTRRFVPLWGSGEFMRRWSQISLCIALAFLAAGCPKGKGDYSAAKKALDVQDYDAAVDYYLKANKSDPHNANYKIGLNRARFEAGQQHIHNGIKLREKGDLQAALAEFQRATLLDPSSVIADQEVRKTLELIAERSTSSETAATPLVESGQPVMSSLPPEIKPLSRAPINLKMSNDAKVVFDTIGKLAGLTVIYDPDMQARRVSTELNNVTLEQALDIVCLESKSFWKPVTENTTGLRQLLDLKRIQQVNAQNAIIIRDTPDKLALAGKIIGDIDKAKPEVIVQVEVLEARLDRMRNLGIQPGTSASVAFNPNNSSTTSKIMQTPELRAIDGQPAKLKIGDRVPVATGSFQAGVGVGSTGGSGFVNPLVNTQFQYIDVGVNIDVTPHVHANRDVSLKVEIEVSAVTGQASIGGITQPIISQRKVTQEIRLKEGEVSILGGLIQRTDSKILNGWPGLAKIPVMRYLFSSDNVDRQEDEVLIVLTPRIVRFPEWSRANLRSISSGTETYPGAKRELDVKAPA